MPKRAEPERQDSSGRRKYALIPLSVPRAVPQRLDELERAAHARVSSIIDAVQSLDEAIEDVHGLLGELMVRQRRRIGIEWRPHRTRGGTFPAVYRSHPRRPWGSRIPIHGQDQAREGPKRYWVEHIVPPTGLGRMAAARRTDLDFMHMSQAKLLQTLQDLIQCRTSALAPLTALLRGSAAWRRMNAAGLETDAGTGLPGFRAFVAELARDTAELRLNERTLAAWHQAKANALGELNEQSNEERLDGSPSKSEPPASLTTDPL